MKILYHDIQRKSPDQESSIAAQYFPDLDTMLGESDCVVLATPASPDGRQLIDSKRVRKFKVGSRYVASVIRSRSINGIEEIDANLWKDL
jgi:lactate dehydrogenase-like 2-hydroxyacid dehydrogenase